ncbi:MAG TPA: superoxide dismutase family protein [Candidatus Limnocylindrales bacterium]|nr:superoxide dismutase family protein [Candidatus Limnocylindrales bacterium]
MRSLRTTRTIFALAVLAAAVATLPSSATATDTASGARASVRDVNGVFLGTVTLDSSSGKLFLTGRLSGLAAGFHGFHIHAVGICDPRAVDPTGAVVPFFTAGGHLNPGGTTHGNHAGDLPSLKVSADGRATAVTETSTVTLAQIFDADGAAIIIHAGPDNFANIPTRYSAAGVPGPDAATLATGDSGARTACGVLRPVV